MAAVSTEAPIYGLMRLARWYVLAFAVFALLEMYYFTEIIKVSFHDVPLLSSVRFFFEQAQTWPLAQTLAAMAVLAAMADYVGIARRKYLADTMRRARIRWTVAVAVTLGGIQGLASAIASYFQGSASWPAMAQTSLLQTLGVTAGAIFLTRVWIGLGKTRQIEQEHNRGRETASEATVAATLTAEARQEGDGYVINQRAGLTMATSRLRPATIIWGTSGAGKGRILTPWIKQIVDRIGQQNMVAYLVDLKGEYVAKLADKPGVHILAPRDTRSIKFQPLVRDPGDASLFAQTLIPLPAEARDPFWIKTSRGILGGLALALSGLPGEVLTWRSLFDAVCNLERCQTLLDRTPQGRMVLESLDGGQMTTSLVTTLKTDLQFLASLAWAWGDESDFDLETFIREKRGMVVLRLDDADPDLSAKICTLFLESAMRISLSLHGEVYSRDPAAFKKQAWFILDEFESLLKMESLSRLIKTGRSKGIGAIIATQTVSGVKERYGQGGLDAIAENSTWIVLNSEGESAQFLSRGLGDREELMTKKSQQTDSIGLKRAEEGVTQDYRITPVAMPGELAQLRTARQDATLEGYLRTRNMPVVKMEWATVTDALPDIYPVDQLAPWVGKIQILEPSRQQSGEDKPRRKIEDDIDLEPESSESQATTAKTKSKTKPDPGRGEFDF